MEAPRSLLEEELIEASANIGTQKMSHPEFFGFQDVIKIKNKSMFFLIILKFSQHLFSLQEI